MSRTPLSADAGVALGLASTAMPFARDPEAQVERWFRALRIPEQTQSRPRVRPQDTHAAQAPSDPVSEVSDRAELFARRRGSECVCPGDLLVGVMEVYGETADQVLESRGTTVAELKAAIAHDRR